MNSVVKDAACIEEAVNKMAGLKSTAVTKKLQNAISEMEKLLMLWIEDQIWHSTKLDDDISKGMMVKYPEGTKTFTVQVVRGDLTYDKSD